ncbi:MAG: pyridoxal phosphate-dependent aminotransferase family protein [Cyclobacteriaceae bacterium]|nr:pyridoxal phosphate-dependent aminotransferase family protein [Cyclobacteriaceae bacterium]
MNNYNTNSDLHDILINSRTQNLEQRIISFSSFLQGLSKHRQHFYARKIISSADREVEIIDNYTKRKRKMLMFGSNNYLGLANHPYVRKKVVEAIDQYGVGVGGPPLLNGYSKLVAELEERLSDLKGTEDTMIFSSGYCANLGMVIGLFNEQDHVYFDEKNHASFFDGLRMVQSDKIKFRHNDIQELDNLLTETAALSSGEKFIMVEGVYSMTGDLSPLDDLVKVRKKHHCILMVDDAHGTGIIGKNGSGTPEYFGIEKEIDVVMGTFSKTFSVTGGFISSTKPIISYLRYFARPYMFSASLTPITLSAVLAGLDIIKNEPDRRMALHDNVKYAFERLRPYGVVHKPNAGIIALSVPKSMNIRQAAFHFHKSGLFINAIEYPAVPIDNQIFRLSFMATHSKDDINKLVDCVEEVWSMFNINT